VVLDNDLAALAASAGDRESCEAALASLRVPSLFYFGADNPRVDLARRRAGRVGGAVLVAIPEAGRVSAGM
jgi:pimeloyl-ACP methyl ester carboxylesterase